MGLHLQYDFFPSVFGYLFCCLSGEIQMYLCYLNLCVMMLAKVYIVVCSHVPVFVIFMPLTDHKCESFLMCQCIKGIALWFGIYWHNM